MAQVSTQQLQFVEISIIQCKQFNRAGDAFRLGGCCYDNISTPHSGVVYEDYLGICCTVTNGKQIKRDSIQVSLIATYLKQMILLLAK